MPWLLALAAVIVMLPALRGGLFADDVVQRLAELKPGQLPPHAAETGFVPDGSGRLFPVVNHLFDFIHTDAVRRRAADYGILPWWAPQGCAAALWRPLTAFTHWVDYQLYPNSPALMHAHNIAWYTAAVLLVASLYRKIDSSLCVSGLAGCLWMLDANTYFPVMFVANRGFIIALILGLLCLRAHIRWREEKAPAWMWASALCLTLSILADEGGASTLAFLMAYALVLERGAWKKRFASLLPATAVIVVWRIVYVSLGYGVRNFPGYVDPGYSPLVFLKDIAPRLNGLLGGQLTGLPPELAFALSPTWTWILALVFAVFTLLCLLAFLSVLRESQIARFWAAVAVLAAIPAATVAPLTKNLGFVAVGAFGVISVFLFDFASRARRALLAPALRAISWCVAVCLVLAHVFGAVAARVALAWATPLVPEIAAHACSFKEFDDIGEHNVIMVNDPSMLSGVMPFDRAYHRLPLPKAVRVLTVASVSITVSRADDATLVLTAPGGDLFDCPDLGASHLCYVFKNANEFLFGRVAWKQGDRVTNSLFDVNVLEISAKGQPRSVAFHFHQPLESADNTWLWIDWPHWSLDRFILPHVGQTITIPAAARP